MKIIRQEQFLSVSEIPELTAVNAAQFRDALRDRMAEMPAVIEIDLSTTRFMDSSGLGALFSLYRSAALGGGAILRLINPTPELENLLQLTQMHQLFEIAKR